MGVGMTSQILWEARKYEEEQVLSAVLYTAQEADGISFIADGTVNMDVVKYDLV